MKKSPPVKLDNFDRFLEDMAQVLNIPRGELDKIVFQNEAVAIKENPHPISKERKASQKTVVR